MAEKVWKDEYVYKRLIEILDAYWLEEPDEAAVNILLHFRKKDGQTQNKRLCWRNPNTENSLNWDISGRPQIRSADEILLEEIKTFYEISEVK